MEHLTAQCFFQYEARSPVTVEARSGYECIDMRQLSALVERGRAELRPVVLHSSKPLAMPGTPSYVSVKVREGSQGDVRQLPCGARSLILDPRSGAILVRGVNKFVDLADVGTAWSDATGETSVWGRCQVWAQRKMAGFVVTLFSLDGRTLSLMSKHALDGPHVTMARRVLDARLSGAQQTTMAAALFDLDAAASCECIAAEDAMQHPVPEASEFAEQLILLAVQKAHSVMELALPFAQTHTLAAQWGLTCVPHVALSSADELDEVRDAVEQWRACYPRFASSFATTALAEGFVLLIETTLATKETAWCRPIRLKLKTVQYITLRALRTSLTEDDGTVTADEVAAGAARKTTPRRRGSYRSPLSSSFYHHVVHAWAAASSLDLVRLVRSEGVHVVQARLEQAVQASRHVHYRDAECSVGVAYERVCSIAAHEAAGRCELTAWLLCGLPGAGKTTLAQTLVRRLAQTDAASMDPMVRAHEARGSVPRFAFVLHLSRDAVTRAVAAAHGIDASSSKHKQRRLRPLVHRAMHDKVRALVQYAYLRQAPGLLLLDACHASREARLAWRRLLPRQLDDLRVIHVDCPDAAVALQRLTGRRDHELIADDAGAQRALYVVRLKFCPPQPPDEPCVHCNSALHSAEHLASELLHVPGQRRTCITGGLLPRTTVLEADTVGRAAAELRAALVYSLLGTTLGAWGVDGGGAPVQRAERQGRFIRVTIDATTCATLWRVIGGVLADHLAQMRSDADETAQQNSTPLWRRPLRGLLKRYLPRILSPLLATCEEDGRGGAISATLVSGQTRWLAGWLQLSRSTSPATSTAVVRALHERFDDMPDVVQRARRDEGAAHVTLFYTTDAAERDVGSGVWDATGWRVGQSVEVRVHEVLLDRFAVCCAVTLPGYPSHTQWPCGAMSTPLHLTLGTTPHTAARYAGAMFAQFEQWQKWNAELHAQCAAGTARRSQAKFVNFVRLRLDEPLCIQGTLHDS